MSDLLQTVLFGTFIPPDTPGRIVSFDDPKKVNISVPVRLRGMATRTAVIQALKSDSSAWFTTHDIAESAGICLDTSKKILCKLASEHLVSKRNKKISQRGHLTAVFKWINKDAKKQLET